MCVDWFEGYPLVCWGIAHALGIVVAFLTRLSLGSRIEASLRGALAAGMLAVAAIALSTEIAASLGWIVSSATIGVMVIAAVWETASPPHDPMLAQLISAAEPA